MSEKLILYYHILSPPCRAVLMCGAELGIEFDLKVVDLMGLEHKTEEYIEVSYMPIDGNSQINSKVILFRKIRNTRFHFLTTMAL